MFIWTPNCTHKIFVKWMVARGVHNMLWSHHSWKWLHLSTKSKELGECLREVLNFGDSWKEEQRTRFQVEEADHQGYWGWNIYSVSNLKNIADKTNHLNGRKMLWHKISEIPAYVHVAPSWWDWRKAKYYGCRSMWWRKLLTLWTWEWRVREAGFQWSPETHFFYLVHSAMSFPIYHRW